MVAEIWLAGSMLLVLLAITRSSLLQGRWQQALPSILAGAWIYLTWNEVSRKSLAQIYAPLAQPDLLVLILMVPIIESLIGIRAAVRLIAPDHRVTRWQRVVEGLPPLSLFAGLRLLIAQAFQAAPQGIDFDTFGTGLVICVSLILLLLPIALQWVLPQLVWRIELYLMLRVILLLAILVGYGLATLQPVSQLDASFSWRGTAIVFIGMCSIALIGAVSAGAVERLRRRMRPTTGYLTVEDHRPVR